MTSPADVPGTPAPDGHNPVTAGTTVIRFSRIAVSTARSTRTDHQYILSDEHRGVAISGQRITVELADLAVATARDAERLLVNAR